jgi:hypothetical protein
VTQASHVLSMSASSLAERSPCVSSVVMCFYFFPCGPVDSNRRLDRSRYERLN